MAEFYEILKPIKIGHPHLAQYIYSKFFLMKYFFTLFLSVLALLTNAQIVGEAYSVQNDAGITGSYGQF